MPETEPGNVLEITALKSWYDESHVLQGVDMHIRDGEVVALLGRNGAGRSTIMKCIMGLVSQRSGSIRIYGNETVALAPAEIARLGVGFCPEERGIFASLNVLENLLLPPEIRPGGVAMDEIFELFPNLRARLTSQGTKLSGGEQQMLAIARILRTGARLLLLDEPTEGLAPVIIQEIGRTIAKLRKKGFTILLVEQNFHFASQVADRFYVLEHGRIVDEFDNSAVGLKKVQMNHLLGV